MTSDKPSDNGFRQRQTERDTLRRRNPADLPQYDPGTEVKIVTGIDDHSRFVVCAKAVMRAEFFRATDGQHATLGELQAALDAWVADYNTARPHQSCGGRPPAERFRLAGRNRAAVEPGEVPAPAARPVRARQRLAGASRWVNAHGKISLGGFTYAVGARYAGEPVEAPAARPPDPGQDLRHRAPQPRQESHSHRRRR